MNIVPRSDQYGEDSFPSFPTDNRGSKHRSREAQTLRRVPITMITLLGMLMMLIGLINVFDLTGSPIAWGIGIGVMIFLCMVRREELHRE